MQKSQAFLYTNNRQTELPEILANRAQEGKTK